MKDDQSSGSATPALDALEEDAPSAVEKGPSTTTEAAPSEGINVKELNALVQTSKDRLKKIVRQPDQHQLEGLPFEIAVAAREHQKSIEDAVAKGVKKLEDVKKILDASVPAELKPEDLLAPGATLAEEVLEPIRPEDLLSREEESVSEFLVPAEARAASDRVDKTYLKALEKEQAEAEQAGDTEWLKNSESDRVWFERMRQREQELYERSAQESELVLHHKNLEIGPNGERKISGSTAIIEMYPDGSRTLLKPRSGEMPTSVNYGMRKGDGVAKEWLVPQLAKMMGIEQVVFAVLVERQREIQIQGLKQEQQEAGLNVAQQQSLKAKLELEDLAKGVGSSHEWISGSVSPKKLGSSGIRNTDIRNIAVLDRAINNADGNGSNTVATESLGPPEDQESLSDEDKEKYRAATLDFSLSLAPSRPEEIADPRAIKPMKGIWIGTEGLPKFRSQMGDWATRGHEHVEVPPQTRRFMERMLKTPELLAAAHDLFATSKIAKNEELFASYVSRVKGLVEGGIPPHLERNPRNFAEPQDTFPAQAPETSKEVI
ncbi:hypothetical protein HYV73_03625 [Candidatus Uhrbacteria bacterium]|nr:hypothetical protein [Candidatus Uhrbacteria bacterium]